MMSYRIVVFPSFAVTLLVLVTGCGGGSHSNKSLSSSLAQVETQEDEMRTALDALDTDVDFTLLIKAENGRVFVYSKGSSSETTMYRSASASKMVTAATILSFVRKGDLTLSDHPQDYISWWPTTGNLAAIELRDLLNFTSGLSNDNLCLNYPNDDFESCVEDIVGDNPDPTYPGDEFYYSSAHLQVAGLMTIKASGLSSWQEVFDTFKADTGLFKNSEFDLPSSTNPRLAAGMTYDADEYLEFLDALYYGRILDADLIGQMTSDQIGDANIGFSPTLVRGGEDWHYGFGNWIECHANPFDCTGTTRISSPGAFGAYPFIDFENNYYGIFAREGNLGTGSQGYELFESVAPKLETWASMNRN